MSAFAGSHAMTLDTAPHLVGHWPFDGDFRSRAAAPLASNATAVRLESRDGRVAAVFNGIDSRIEVADHPALRLGTGDFTIALWLHTASSRDGGDNVGDLVSKFDPDVRCGLNLIVSTHTGVTQTTQSNYRHLQFGIDDGHLDPAWTDCGRPGAAVKVSALAAMYGSLYAGTFENGPGRCGHLWRYERDGDWLDMGAAPPGCNNVGSIAWFDGHLYCATSRYASRGSSLGDPLNTFAGGWVYRLRSEGDWVDCGRPAVDGAAPDDPATSYGSSDQADDTNCLTVFRGRLFATSHHRRGAYVYEGGRDWRYVGPDLRVMSFTIHQGMLYALINGGGVYRYEQGSDWAYCGEPPRSTQTYCAVTWQGDLYVGTWPECEVIRYDGGESWTPIGMLGAEREVMAAALYNGKCYFGTLPMANVFRMDGDGFTYMGNLDNDPNVYVRRVWSMAVFDGQLFAGTLPGGHVRRRRAGCMATCDRTLPSGWRHIAAVREGATLTLYLDGSRVAQSTVPEASGFDLDNDRPLRIGGGIGHVLNGALRDVRIYDRALEEREIVAAGSEEQGAGSGERGA
ncbi:MAG: hypothetical protein CMJ18_24355 [Phycisphaeraceae bacterium]|nr:hypothetical protein [Phycisphaeraceae bacterium]